MKRATLRKRLHYGRNEAFTKRQWDRDLAEARRRSLDSGEGDDDPGLAEGKRRSLEDDEKIRKGKELVTRRLHDKGLMRLETAAHGNCLFIAIADSANVGISHRDLRHYVCEELTTHADWFDGFTYGSGSFMDHIADLRRQNVWGDHLCVVAAATILMRPIHVVGDGRVEATSTAVIEPAPWIAQSAWGPSLIIAHYAERHYERTAPLAEWWDSCVDELRYDDDPVSGGASASGAAPADVPPPAGETLEVILPPEQDREFARS